MLPAELLLSFPKKLISFVNLGFFLFDFLSLLNLGGHNQIFLFEEINLLIDLHNGPQKLLNTIGRNLR